jgi:small-conductance mechanosensitive channel
MEFFRQSLYADWQAFLDFSPRLLYAAGVLLVFAAIARVVRYGLGKVLNRSFKLQPHARFVQRLVGWIIRIAGLLLALGVMGFTGIAASLLATGGVVAIVLGFAFREIGENLFAGIFLAFSRPFELGDLIKTGDLTGEVKAIDIRSVHIRTSDACDVFVPSSQIFSQELFNYTRDGLRRPRFTIGVAYHDRPEEVLALLERTVRGTPEISAEPPAVVNISEFGDSVIVYEVFLWVDVTATETSLLDITNDAKVRCWRALKESGMTFSTDVTTAIELRHAE